MIMFVACIVVKDELLLIVVSLFLYAIIYLMQTN